MPEGFDLRAFATPATADAIERHLTGDGPVTGRDDRPMRYIETAEDGTETVVYRASHLGGCDKELLAVAAGMTGAEMPEWFRKVLDEGSLAEGIIAGMWEEETGVPTVNDQMEIELEIGEINDRRVIIRGHIDGEAFYQSGLGLTEHALREYKKFRESTWENFLRQGIEVQKNYPWQLSVYMHALNASAEVVGGHLVGYYDIAEEGDPNRTIYAKLEDVPDAVEIALPEISEVKCHRVEFPPIPFKDILKRIVRWERLIDEGTPLDDGKCVKPYSYPCPFYQLHPDDDEPEPYAIAKANTKVGAAVREIHETTTEIAELAARMRELDKGRKAATKVLQAELPAMGQEADEAKFLTYDGVTIERKRGPRKGYTVADGFTDNFSAAKEESKPSPAVKRAATRSETKAKAAKSTTVRVRGKAK